MNYRNILKIYKLERELAPDDLALLNTLRGMSDAERELLAESLGPPAKVKAKPKTTRKIQYCEVCNWTRRAAVHKDQSLKDYHEFVAGNGSSGASSSKVDTPDKKSARASSLRQAIAGTAGGDKPNLCAYELDGKVCKGSENDGIHDETLGYLNYHPFQSASPAHSAPTPSSSNNGSPDELEVGSGVEMESA